MKKKKLMLKKEVIASLSNQEMNNLRGGVKPGGIATKPVDALSLAPQICCIQMKTTGIVDTNNCSGAHFCNTLQLNSECIQTYTTLARETICDPNECFEFF